MQYSEHVVTMQYHAHNTIVLNFLNFFNFLNSLNSLNFLNFPKTWNVSTATPNSLVITVRRAANRQAHNDSPSRRH